MQLEVVNDNEIILIFDYVIKNKNPFNFIYDWEICLVYIFCLYSLFTLCSISIFKDLLFNIIINKINYIHTVCFVIVLYTQVMSIKCASELELILKPLQAGNYLHINKYYKINIYF